MRPDTFTVHQRPAVEDSFPIDAYDNETLWLPKLGPTAFVTLRLVQHDLGQVPIGEFIATDGALTFSTVTVAERVGTSPSRLWVTINRLVRFDFFQALDDESAFAMFAGMRKPSSREFRRLPEHVLAAYRQSQVAS